MSGLIGVGIGRDNFAVVEKGGRLATGYFCLSIGIHAATA
jgi:hypothetical protein